jgi:hypothetical protein
MSERMPWFDGRLSLGNLITIGTVALGIVAGWFAFDNRLSLTEDRQRADRLLVDKIAGRVDLLERDLTPRVIRIEEKLSAQTDTLQRILRSVEARDWRDPR